jgi:hypothetical protein
LEVFNFLLIHSPVAKTEVQSEIELLQAEVDENDQSFFRILVDKVSVKYITIEPGTYSSEDMCFDPTLASILPKLPPGDWNDGLVAKNPNDGRPHFARVSLTQFPGVQTLGTKHISIIWT